MRNAVGSTEKRLARIKNKPGISPFFSLIHHFEKGDHLQIYQRETFRESLKLSFMFFIANLFTLVFFVFAARKLGVVDYSELGVLLSIFFMFAAANNLLNIVIIKYLSEFIAKTQYGRISRFCDLYVKAAVLGGFIVFVTMGALSSVLADIMALRPAHIIILGALIWAFLVWNALMGVLNGLQYFTLLGLNKIFQAFFSALIGLGLLFMGFGANGAILGMAVGTIIAIPLAIYSARDIFFIQPQKIGRLKIIEYLFPSVFIVLCVGIILNIDVPLLRYFLNSFESGSYAAVSLIGSIVFSFSMVSCMVMFPKVAQRASNGEKTGFLLKRALIYVFYMCLGVTLLYFIFSKVIVRWVFGGEFMISQYIGVYALAMSFLALSNVLIMYNLALEKRFLLYLVPLAALTEVFLITVVHNTIWQVVVLIVTFQLLFLTILARFSESDLAFLDRIWQRMRR